MKHTSTLPALAVTSALLLTTVISANAANIYLVDSNDTSGESGFVSSGHWSPNVPLSAANDYFVTAKTLRSPQAAAVSNTFAGNSLTITGGRLGLANSRSGGSNTIINNFTITGGTAISNYTSQHQTLSGTLNMSGANFALLNTVDSAPRTITIASQISGDGTMGVIQAGILNLTGADNTFSGTWTVGGTGVTVIGNSYSNSSLRVSTLYASAEGSLGFNSSLVGSDYSVIKIGYDWQTTGTLSLGLNSKLFLENDLTVSSLSINGANVGSGVFTYDFLNENYAGYFDTTGLEGTITVIPEPSTYAALLGVATLGLAIARRRRRA